MLRMVNAEACQRLASSRALLRVVDAHERSAMGGDAASRAGKGLVFVQTYAVYEYVVVHTVQALISAVNAKNLPLNQARVDLQALALDAAFTTIIEGSLKKTWSARVALLRQTKSPDVMQIRDNLFPKDGSHFRPSQLELIWSLFGVPHPTVPAPRLLGHIVEMVEQRNAIAHGETPPESVGGRFTIADLDHRIADTEAVCSHITSTVGNYLNTPGAFT